MKQLFILIALYAVSTGLQAKDSTESETVLNATQVSKTNEHLANLWGLTLDEYTEYKLIMEGPRGIWTPDLDPITVLGINAKSESEREAYAEKLAKLERARVTRELAFEMAYQAAQRRLFGDIPLYETPQTQAVLTGLGEVSNAKTVNVFINKACATCKAAAIDIVKSGVTANFYFVGFSGEEIKAWAVDVGITGQMISEKQVTLNFDGGRAKTLGIQQYPFIQEVS